MSASPPALDPALSGAGSPTYWDVLRLDGVGRLLCSAFFARLGEQAFSLAIVLYVYSAFGSARLAGLAVFFSAAPGLIVSPLAGALLDRVGPVRGIAADLVASAVLVTAMALAARPGADGAILLLSLAALYSLTSPLSLAGARTLTPRLVPPAALERVNALDASSYSVVGVLGPALAGALFAGFGGRVTLLTLAGLYATASALLPGLGRASARPQAPGGRQTLARSAADGLKYVLKHPVLRALVACYGLYQVAFGVLTVTVTYVAGGTGHAARDHGVRVGLLWALVGVAGVVGALLAGRGYRSGRERRAIVTGILATGVACAAMALGSAVALVLGLLAVGLAAGPVDVGLLTLRQRRTDPDWLGRVLAVSISLNVLGFPIGSALGGFVLSGTRSPALAFLTAAAAAALGTAAAGVLLPRRRATPT